MNDPIQADLIIYSGAVYTANSKVAMHFSGDLAFKDNKIIGIGKKDDLIKFLGKETQVINCSEDSLIMPAINDSHMQLQYTIASLTGVPLRYVSSAQQCVANAVAWGKKHSNCEWVFGLGWHFTHWQDKKPPDNALLNNAFPHRPVCLVDTDFHAAWLNDRALVELGISKESTNPQGSVITRNEDGSLTGYVQEKIVQEVADLAIAYMELDTITMAENLRMLMRECNSYGITGISDMLHTEEKWLSLFERLASEGKLTCRIALTENFWIDDFVTEADRLSGRFPDKEADVYFYGIKGFYDGVAMGHTSWQINSFYNRPDYCGEPVVSEDVLCQKTMEAIQSGHHVHIHACGDMSIRKAMDWWEEELGKGLNRGDQRFTITHNDTVATADIPVTLSWGL